MIAPAPIWTRRVARNDIPDQGLRVELVADEAVRAALEKAAGVRKLRTLKAFFDLTRRGAEGVHIAGEIAADLVQDCVVTLDPIEQNLVETVDLTFVPPAAGTERGHPSEIEFGMETEPEMAEPPEILAEGGVDLGALVVEYFLLGVDPYPRKAGAEFMSPVAGSPPESPFAALAALKKADPKT
jgi:hypothetical protein